MILEKKIRLWYDWGSFFSQITDPDLIWDHFLWRSDQNTRSFCHCLKMQTWNFFSEFICTKIIINVRNIKGVLMKLWFHIMKSESTKKHTGIPCLTRFLWQPKNRVRRNSRYASQNVTFLYIQVSNVKIQ